MSWNFLREVLLASGIKGKNLQENYGQELDQILKQFLTIMNPPPSPVAIARKLFVFLWQEKPARYKPSGHYRLGSVINAQLSKEVPAVGNCLGLTLLYNCLLGELGILTQALYLENAFDRGPHVLTLFPVGGTMIDIENILPEGFDYQGHRFNPLRTRWGEQELVADVYFSVGNELFERGEYKGALKNYDKPIKFNPRCEKAYFNKLILLDKMKIERIKNKSSMNGS